MNLSNQKTFGNAVRAWQAPSLTSGEDAGSHDEKVVLPTADQIEALQNAAHEEGFARGYQEGLAAAQEKIQTRVDHLDSLLDCLGRPLAQLSSQVEEELVLLALAIAKQLVRREFKVDPAHIIGVIRTAVAQLPVCNNRVVIELHPEDASLVREMLNLDEEAEASWRINEVPTLTRGGCRIDNGESHIDATVETRINQVAASLFGGERAVDDE
ncbi:flagellar assembly protein FliH [Thiolapillus brandeum]|uniref:Flagellar assembly protein FliH n=1 Tax=Thiolapillus brandeum TaxID=1076588 RepID=A0A7U6GIN3_9GAMM|nr:flagellar assembly protein FliH [Thiolapillus brandeum]BAO44308.1 flagellar assembly protein FliH [Thiolapillus brandeum]